MIDLLVETETLRDLRVRRISQHGIAAADQHRDISGADLKPVEQLLRLAVAIEIDVVERMPVPRQELPSPERSGTVRRADDDDVTQIARDQLEAAQNEGPHQDLAQLGIGLDQREQLLAIEFESLRRAR